MVTLPLKVYTQRGAQIAACLNVEDAINVASSYLNGATVRYQRRVVWENGKDSPEDIVLVMERISTVAFFKREENRLRRLENVK